MKKKSESRSQTHQMFAHLVLTIYCIQIAQSNPTDQNKNAEILMREPIIANSTNGVVPQILRLAQKGNQKVVQTPEIIAEQLFTLKSDPVRVQSDFKTVDISILNRQRDKEHAKKVAIIQEDLQSRIKINEPETTPKQALELTESEDDPEEIIKKQAKVKEDIESRILLDDGIVGYRKESEREDKLHYPVKRSDDDYYADEPDSPQQTRMTTEAPKEEDSFFSIFESLFGSSDDDSHSKKKSKPEDEPMYKDMGDPNIKENIKTVGSLLKPMKPIDKPESETQNAYAGYQNNAPEYRIVNNFHATHSHKQTYKRPDSKPTYHSFYRPTEKPLRPYKPYSTSGYEDYDLEEFIDKGDNTQRVKYVSPVMTTISTHKYPTTPSTTPVTTTPTATTTPKNTYDNKLKFPSIQKKNDYINRNRYQEVKSEVTERITERVTYQKPEIKTTTELYYYSRPNHENKDTEIKTQKIQESPNFYNLINLPVRYSTKDTAIPLISTSYANTKIQGMGAHKYEKGSNGKYPNHKYDQISSSTTKRPNYWATKRTSTEKSATSFRPSPMISKTTTKYIPGSDLNKAEYDDFAMGLAPELGNYGSKTGVEMKTQTPLRETSTSTLNKETTTKKNDYRTTANLPHSIVGFQREQTKTKYSETPERTSTKPVKELYEDYDYDSTPDQEPEVRPSNLNKKYPQNFLNKETDLEYKAQYHPNSYKATGRPNVSPITEPQRPNEALEYEYYDYDVDPSTTTTSKTTTTTVTTSKYKVKYPNLHKDKIITSSNEKLAVVIPSKNHEFYNENLTQPSSTRTSTIVVLTTVPTTTSTSAPTISSKPSQTTTSATKPKDNEIADHFKKTTQTFRANQVYKEPAPVFEDIREDYTTKQILISTTKKISEKSTTTTEPTKKPVIVTSSSKEQEANANIVLVPTKETFKNAESEISSSQPPSSGPFHNIQPKPTESHHSTHDHTTEFTVGVVHSGNGIPYGSSKISSEQGHFVASSISTNPYGDDEPFRPIPKPPGMTSSFLSVHKDPQRQPPKNTPALQKKRPIPTPPPLDETEPIHEPHEFIPSPQFHRPMEPKPSIPVRPSSDVDYDFEGIQTEPKPGQYVIFSKPQLNPEMNESQVKKKTEISSGTKAVSNVPHFQDKVNPYWQESQQHVVFNPSEGQIYQNAGKPKPPSDKLEPGRPTHGNQPKDGLPLQLVPPRGSQHEKPFEGNFVLPEEKQESSVNYPRPHWEKNSKPSFLMNTLSNKNDIVGNRHPPVPPQMSPTLVPPNGVPPQRFRRPVQSHMPPIRKNFNEGGVNVKQKPNLPNILPQFRPNTKVGSGPYHRPPGYHGSNRRNGMNRYHEKEHGNFPYHIHHPEKDAVHREYEMDSEIIPKFITNRGKLPNDMWNSQGMQKRFGQGPQNPYLEENYSQPNQKILRRHQRTPVTTLQMLKQMPGIKTQKAQVSREDGVDSTVPLSPPIYKTYPDQPKKDENVYIVYPARAPQKLHSGDTKVFIVSDTKSKKNYYNLTKTNDYTPLVTYNKKENLTDLQKNSFPYGFVKPAGRISVSKKEQKESEENFQKNVIGNETTEHKNFPNQEVLQAKKDEKIDMTLHMQSNNQWNEVKTLPDLLAPVRNPPEIIRNDHYRFSDQTPGVSPDNSAVHMNPPSEFHTSIKDDSAFTLGAVMHTISEGSKKGLVTNIPLRGNDEKVNLPKLNVNERISNGKIVTVSMPLDVKQDSSERENQYQFQAPFQPSSSLISNESHPVSQGWSIVKNPDDETDTEDGKKTTETSTSSFNFENFKPELIGGFKPIFELPEEPEESKKEENATEKMEEVGSAR